MVDTSFTNLSVPSCIAGVIFDATSNWVSGFQRKIYTNDSLHAELQGIMWAFSVAKDYGATHLHIFSDCSKAVTLLNQTKSNSLILDHVLMLCRDHIQCFQETKVQYCPRKHNVVPDKLAKEGRKSDLDINVTRVLPTTPSCILDLWDNFVLGLKP